MKIIISPAKKMKVDLESQLPMTRPVFLDRAERLKEWLQGLTYEQQKSLWQCNDDIARENARRFAHMDLHKNLTPALLAYEGIQYQYMAPVVFENQEFSYVQDHLRILSGFYGVLKPFDGVVPYRLEMQAKVHLDGLKSLYGFWGDALYKEVMDDSRTVINLASKEYAKCLEKYLQPGDCWITCIFGELQGSKVVQKGVYAKMARGEMVRYLAAHGAREPEIMKDFCWSGYRFAEALSNEGAYVFVK